MSEICLAISDKCPKFYSEKINPVHFVVLYLIVKEVLNILLAEVQNLHLKMLFTVATKFMSK